MGPTLSIFIRNTGSNNMSCDLMNNSKTALLQMYHYKPTFCCSTSVSSNGINEVCKHPEMELMCCDMLYICMYFAYVSTAFWLHI